MTDIEKEVYYQIKAMVVLLIKKHHLQNFGAMNPDGQHEAIHSAISAAIDFVVNNPHLFKTDKS